MRMHTSNVGLWNLIRCLSVRSKSWVLIAVCVSQDPRFQREFYGTLQKLLSAKLTAPVPVRSAGPSNTSGMYDTREAEEAQRILQQSNMAAQSLKEKQEQELQDKKGALERKMTERTAKREAQVRSIMKSKFSGGTAKVSKSQARAQKNQVKKLFDQIDADNDGALDSEEIQGLLGLLGIKLSKDELNDIMQQVCTIACLTCWGSHLLVQFGQDKVPAKVQHAGVDSGEHRAKGQLPAKEAGAAGVPRHFGSESEKGCAVLE